MSDWTERHHVLDYDSAVALRYHGRRKAFLDALSRLGPALSVILGGTAFATVVTGAPLAVPAGASLLVAVTGGINLAFGVGDRSRQQEALFRRWGELRAELAAVLPGDDAALRLLEVKRAQLDAESPWQLVALSVICENEEKALRRSGTLYRVGWLQRALADWFTLPGWRPVPDPAGRHAHA